MNAIFRKELRGLRSPFLITVIVIAAGLAGNITYRLNPAFASFSITAFGTCCLLIGASAFGTEFQARTMGVLLTQPISRQRIWFLKLGALAAVLAAAYFLMWLAMRYLTGSSLWGEAWIRDRSLTENFFKEFAVTPWLLFGVLCTLPYYTLAMRNTLSGLVVSFVAPWVMLGISMLGMALLEWLTSFPLKTLLDEFDRYYIGLFIGYCLFIYWRGYRRFLDYEEIDSKGKEIKLPASLQTKLVPLVNMFKPSYSSPLKSLVRKEMELQRGVFIIAATVTAMLLCEALAWKLHPLESIGMIMVVTLLCHMMLAPTMTGVTAVAEERHLGTMAWQLTLPVSRRTQWRVKFSVALVTFAVVGLGLPMLWILVGKYLIGMPGLIDAAHKDFIAALGAWTPVFIAGFLLSLFASSISHNSMRATLTSVALAVACTVIAGIQYPLLIQQQLPNPHVIEFVNWVFTYLPDELIMQYLIGGFATIGFILIAGFAASNFQRNEPGAGRNWLQALAIVGLVYVAIPTIESGHWVVNSRNYAHSYDRFPVRLQKKLERRQHDPAAEKSTVLDDKPAK